MKDGAVRDWTKKPLGMVTRWYGGKAVQWIARCPKCGRRGARYVFIPEKVARAGGGWAHVAVDHKATYHSLYLAYWAIDDHCTVKLTPENIDDLLNIEERADYERWTAEYEAWLAKSKVRA